MVLYILSSMLVSLFILLSFCISCTLNLLLGSVEMVLYAELRHSLGRRVTSLTLLTKPLVLCMWCGNLPTRGLSRKEITEEKSYGLPKIHKTGTPLMPVVSSRGPVIYGMAKIIAKVLQPLVGKLPHHIQSMWRHGGQVDSMWDSESVHCGFKSQCCQLTAM